MKDYIKNFFTKVDIFGQPITLRLNSQNTSKTLFGGVFTVCLAVSLIAILFIPIKEVFQKSKPSISIENLIYPIRPQITLSNSTVNFAFGLTNDGTLVLDLPHYFELKAGIFYNSNTADAIFSHTFLPIRLCTNEDFPQIDNNTFYGATLNYMYCVDNLNTTIFGFWDEPEIQYFTVELYYCRNETSNEKCAPIEEIQNYIMSQPLFFNIYLLNTLVDSQNYSNPVTYHIINLYKGLSSNINKFSEIYLKYEVVESDNGIITEALKLFNSITFDYQIPDFTNLTDENRLMAFYLMTSNNGIIHHRIYRKLTDELGLFGGLSNVLIFILKLLCYIFTTFQRDEKILNKIFDFDIEPIINKASSKSLNKLNGEFKKSQSKMENYSNLDNSNSLINVNKSKKISNIQIVNLYSFDKKLNKTEINSKDNANINLNENGFIK